MEAPASWCKKHSNIQNYLAKHATRIRALSLSGQDGGLRVLQAVCRMMARGDLPQLTQLAVADLHLNKTAAQAITRAWKAYPPGIVALCLQTRTTCDPAFWHTLNQFRKKASCSRDFLDRFVQKIALHHMDLQTWCDHKSLMSEQPPAWKEVLWTCREMSLVCVANMQALWADRASSPPAQWVALRVRTPVGLHHVLEDLKAIPTLKSITLETTTEHLKTHKTAFQELLQHCMAFAGLTDFHVIVSQTDPEEARSAVLSAVSKTFKEQWIQNGSLQRSLRVNHQGMIVAKTDKRYHALFQYQHGRSLEHKAQDVPLQEAEVIRTKKCALITR